MPRLTLSAVRERIANLGEGETKTIRLQNKLILYVRGEGGDSKLADYHAWIPNFNGKGNLWTYLGELDGLMALVAEYRKYTPPCRREK